MYILTGLLKYLYAFLIHYRWMNIHVWHHTWQENHDHHRVDDGEPVNLYITHGQVDVPSGRPADVTLFPFDIIGVQYLIFTFKKKKSYQNKAEFIIRLWNKIYPLWTALREEENLVSIARKKNQHIHFLPLPFSFSSCSCTSAFCLLLLKSHFPSASVFSSPNFTLKNNTFKSLNLSLYLAQYYKIFHWFTAAYFWLIFWMKFLKISMTTSEYSNLPFRFNFKSHHTIVDTV